MKKVRSAFLIWRTKTDSAILAEKSAVCIAAEICLKVIHIFETDTSYQRPFYAMNTAFYEKLV